MPFCDTGLLYSRPLSTQAPHELEFSDLKKWCKIKNDLQKKKTHWSSKIFTDAKKIEIGSA